MHVPKRTPALGALALPADQVDRFDLAAVVARHDRKAARLLTAPMPEVGR